MNGKKVLVGLSYINPKFIEESEVKTSLEINSGSRRLLRKPYLVAAIIALMVFFMGCAVVLLNLERLKVGEESYIDAMRYSEDGSKIPATEKVKQFISIVGAEGSNNHLAMREWMDFKQRCDPDGSIWSASAGFQRPAQYNNYVDVYSQEMVDKIDEICEKYDLKLEGDAVIFQKNVAELFSQVLDIPGITGEKSNLETEFGGARVTECGNFNASYQADFRNPETNQQFTFTLIYDYRDKAYFSTAYLVIEDAEAVEQWNYTLPNGTEVLIASDKGGDAYILCDRKDAFINVTIRNVGRNWDSPADVMSHRDMELIAQSLDYALKPKQVENIAQLQAQLEEIYQAWQDQGEDPAEVERRKQLVEENERQSNYGDLICQIRDNESYFTSYCNAAYENFWDTMGYTLLDVTGDGEEELILGRNGRIHEIWTVRDGKTDRVASSYDGGYLCEGNVYEDYVFLDGKPYHFYFQIRQDGLKERLRSVEYDTYYESWMLDESQDGTGRTPISEEEAMEIIDSYVRIPLELKSVQEYPFE